MAIPTQARLVALIPTRSARSDPGFKDARTRPESTAQSANIASKAGEPNATRGTGACPHASRFDAPGKEPPGPFRAARTDPDRACVWVAARTIQIENASQRDLPAPRQGACLNRPSLARSPAVARRTPLPRDLVCIGEAVRTRLNQGLRRASCAGWCSATRTKVPNSCARLCNRSSWVTTPTNSP